MTVCTDSVVFLRGVRVYAYHGVLDQERRVGGWFTVDLRVHYNIIKASETDSVADTLNYAALFSLVTAEMERPSALLEHVAGRIARSVFSGFPGSTAVDVTVVKENPPMGGSVQGAGVEMHFKYDNNEKV